eukprot:scaffold254562_cov23-Tisochrysis_lutea.AAC.1
MVNEVDACFAWTAAFAAQGLLFFGWKGGIHSSTLPPLSARCLAGRAYPVRAHICESPSEKGFLSTHVRAHLHTCTHMHARASARCTFGCNSGVCHLFAQLTFARRLNWMHLWTPAAAHAFMHAISPGLIYHLKLTTSMLAQSHQTSSGSDRIHSQGTSGSGEESILSL